MIIEIHIGNLIGSTQIYMKEIIEIKKKCAAGEIPRTDLHNFL